MYFCILINWIIIIIISLSISLLPLPSRERRDMYLCVCVRQQTVSNADSSCTFGMLSTQRGFIFYFTDLTLIYFFPN
jgi:hypothetical protein